MESELEKKIINLESIVSCQDQDIVDLNKAILDQQKEITKLEREVQKLGAGIEAMKEEPDDRPPPHY